MHSLLVLGGERQCRKGVIWKRRGSRKEAEGMGRERQVVEEGCKVKGHSAQERMAGDRVWLGGWLQR